MPSSDSIQIVGSSPERFFSWTRSGACQFRPIKGTVKKTPTTTRAMAEELLKAPKEQAENLMIVDLIRHDLSGVQGVTDIHVPRLMVVEEYATVYQLVSVIARPSRATPCSMRSGVGAEKDRRTMFRPLGFTKNASPAT